MSSSSGTTGGLTTPLHIRELFPTKGDYSVNESAVLAAFLRMQSEWPYGLEWREEIRKRQTKC